MEDGIKPDIGVKPIVKQKRNPDIERRDVINGIYVGKRHTAVYSFVKSNKASQYDSILYVSINTGIKLK